MSTELERYKRAVEKAKSFVEKGCSINFSAHMAKELDAIISPPPETEDVPVVRWMLKETGEIHDTPHYHVDNYIKLTGTLKRPKPQPVERTVEVIISNIGVVWNTDGTPCTEVCGKRGFFTYPEDPK